MTLPYAITLALGLATFMLIVAVVKLLLEYVGVRRHSHEETDVLTLWGLSHGNSTADNNPDDRKVHDG